ncbi:MAG: hypothetical protein AABX72_02240 [Nanoarchaeota archaeon]
MRWSFLIVGLLLLLIGLKNYLSDWGLPTSIIEIFSTIPTFSLPSWVFIIVGAILLVFAFRR